MRKISKTRTDDDIVSSTNGSVLNDSHEAQADENEAKSETNGSLHTYTDDEEDLEVTKEKSKKTKGKKEKKKKSAKEDQKNDEAEEEYEVEKVIDSKKIKGKPHYLIRWKGYSADNDTWEPENTLSCQELINKFNEEKENSKHKEKSPSKKGKKRKSGKKDESKTPTKKLKTHWDSNDEDETAEYEVERILEVHHNKKKGKREFLIHWKGWSSKFDSWEPENNLNCPELIKKFMEKVESAKKIDSRNLRVAPESTNRYTLQAPSSGRRLSKRNSQRQRVRYDDAE